MTLDPNACYLKFYYSRQLYLQFKCLCKKLRNIKSTVLFLILINVQLTVTFIIVENAIDILNKVLIRDNLSYDINCLT